MRFLERLVDEPDQAFMVDRLLELKLPELAVMLIGRPVRPQIQNDVHGLQRHPPAILRVDAIQFLIGRDTAIAKAQV